MPLRWHVNLPGPVAYSRPIRRKGKKPGPLTALLVWVVVKPLEAIATQLVSMARQPAKTGRTQPKDLPAHYMPPGWYNSVHGPLYFSGTNWYDLDGQPLF
jgi:hypothetical protein